MGNVLDMYGMFSGSAWDIHGTFMGRLRDIHVTIRENYRTVWDNDRNMLDNWVQLPVPFDLVGELLFIFNI